MENEQKKTDYQILRDFLYDHGNYMSHFAPERMIQEALQYLDYYQNINAPVSTKDFLRKIYRHAEYRIEPLHQEDEDFVYTFAITIYVLCKVEGIKNEYQRVFLTEIEEELKNAEGALYNPEKTEKVILQMLEFRKTASKFYNPMEEIYAIAAGKNPNEVEWTRLLIEMLKFGYATGRRYPFYSILHTFLMMVPDATRRVDILGHLREVAPGCLKEKYIESFIADDDMLVQVYLRLRMLMINNPLPNLWPHDPDLREMALWMNDLTPEELVALSQSILSRNRPDGDPGGVLLHVLTIPKYINKILTESGLEFCQGLYFAEGDKQWILSGKGEEFYERPTLDTQSVAYRNKCYEIFIAHRVKLLQKEYLKEHRNDKDTANYHAEILKDLRLEYHYKFKKGNFQLDDQTAYASLKARMEDMIAYLEEICKKESAINEHVPKRPKQKYCTYIVTNAGKTRDEIETDLVRASQKSANTFVNLLLAYKRDGYLDFRNEASADIFEYLKERYNLKYSLGNFTRYFKL